MNALIKTFAIFITAFLFITEVRAEEDLDFLINKEMVSLKPSAVVTEHRVTLGDIFSGVSDKANQEVAISPAPGEQITLDARQLYRIAKSLKIDWKPISLQSSIVISRASNITRKSDIENAVLNALKNQGIDKENEIIFNTRDVEIHTPVNSMPAVVIRNLSLDNNQRRFSAVAEVISNEISYGVARVSGQIFPVSLIPVASKEIAAGTIVKDSDIELSKVRSDQIRPNTIIDKSRIIGMEAKRNLRQGNSIQTSEINRPVLVDRNQLVSIIINTPSMNLTAKGQAKEEGSEGDLIRVVNTRSNKIIQARIVGEATVTVDTL